MKKITAVIIISMLAAGCSSIGRFGLSEQTPLDEVIAGYKRAVIESQEKTLLEEFVKYKELRHTFALYQISKFTIGAATSIQQSTTTEANASITFPGAGLGLKKDLSVQDTQGGTITLELEPLAKQADGYKKVKVVFDQARGRGSLYELDYYDNAGKALSEDDHKKCQKAVMSVPIHGLTDANGNKAIACVINYDGFRELQNNLREL